MSQWNNSFAYNNQYQDPNMWNSASNGQYANQNPNYYPDRQYQNQYVSFDQFLAQMQNNMPQNTNYNDPQFQNYAINQYNNYTSMPSSSQNTYNYGAGSSTSVHNGEAHPTTSKNKGAVTKESNNYQSEVPFHSNLTPTATEFVPKNSSVNATTSNNWKESSSNLNPEQSNNQSSNTKPESQNSYNKPFLNRNNKHSSSNNSNWRERASSSQPNNASEEPQTHRPNHKKDTNRVQDSENKNHEGSPRTQNDESSKQDSRNGPGKQSKNAKGKNRESDNARTFYNSKTNQDAPIESDSRSRRNNDSRVDRGRDENTRPPRDEPRNGRNQNSGRNDYYRSERDKDSKTGRDQGSRYSSNNRDNDYRSRDNDQRTKDYEPRSRGEGSNRRTYAGSQRVRPEWNIADDEQFANSYVSYREDNYGDRDRHYESERDRERGERERDRDRPKATGAYNSPLKQQKPRRNNNKQVYDEMSKELTQRERLSEQLDKGTLECLVCCERVRQTDSVWSCQNCYHVLHLNCIRKWANSSAHEGKWRCPACQNTSDSIPREYRCMCGSSTNPEYSRGAAGAHTCGGPCRRPRACPHPCTLRCHPGPCPPCQATVSRQCGCGAETRSVQCSSKLAQECGRTCGRPLNCREHACGKPCHEGPCEECTETITQVCYCPSGQSRSVSCTAESAAASQWACGAACGRVLACGAHVCHAACHPPPCEPCALLPELVTTCPCGSLKLSKEQRKSCTDPIPLCGNICARALPCGPAGDRHFCKVECHQGACPTCPDATLVACRCGLTSRDVPCAELAEQRDSVRCQKKCNKKLSCGRHRCRSLCCSDDSHRCGAVCGRMLACQLHRCDQLCHTGHCAPCPIVSFEELSCECGLEVLLPPIRCGARPPACSAPCRRPRPCRHEPHHACHAGDCPPCVVLTTKKCHGGHEERKTIPCSQEEFSCGLPCGQPLPCGSHTCIKVCHKGPCDTGKCTQPCAEKRPSCGHGCGAACHAAAGGACPSPAPCRRPVRATCQCGRRSAERPCHENSRDRARMLSALAATKMAEGGGGSVDLSDVTRPANQLKTLECDDECRLEQRTRQMALALQIRNPDVSAKLAPRYSEHARTTAVRDPAFAAQVHDNLTSLVQKAKKSKQKTRSHSFPSMNRQKRQFVHEMCEHFGCESVAYDAEPNRNVVATADKEKSWLPAMSVLEVLQREAGKRRVPGPVLRNTPSAAGPAAKTTSGWATLTSTKTNAWAARSQAAATQESASTSAPTPTPAPAPKIDYFDNPPE